MIQGIGGGATAIAAMEQGKVDAAAMADPALATLQQRAGVVPILADTRTELGVRQVYSASTYPSAVLYAKSDWIAENRDVARGLATAIVRTLQWISQHTGKEIADRMPAEFGGGDPTIYARAIEAAKPMFSTDGRMPAGGPAVVLDSLSRFTRAGRLADPPRPDLHR